MNDRQRVLLWQRASERCAIDERFRFFFLLIHSLFRQNPRRGGCPLHCAAMNGHLEMVQLFIGAGADVHIKDR